MSEMGLTSKTIIDTMAKHEDAVGALYETYAGKLPQYADFWMTLALQENMHADWIRELSSKVQEGLIHINETRFEIAQLLESLEHLRNVQDLVWKKGVTIEQALTNALMLEESIIEKKFFEIFDTDSPELKEVFQDLSRETEAHIDKIKQMK